MRRRPARAQVAKEELTVGGRLSADRELGLDELDSKLEDMERELLELNANSERLTRRCARPPHELRRRCASVHRVVWFCRR